MKKILTFLFVLVLPGCVAHRTIETSQTREVRARAWGSLLRMIPAAPWVEIQGSDPEGYFRTMVFEHGGRFERPRDAQDDAEPLVISLTWQGGSRWFNSTCQIATLEILQGWQGTPILRGVGEACIMIGSSDAYQRIQDTALDRALKDLHPPRFATAP